MVRLPRDELRDQLVRRGAERLQQVSSLFLGRVQDGSQRRVVPGSRLAAEASGDLLLHLEGPQRPLDLVVGRGNRGVAGEPPR